MPGIGDNGIDFSSLSELFGNHIEQETPPVVEETTPPVVDDSSNDSANDKIDNTKAFAERLKVKSEKVRLEEREKIAKEFGYTSYDQMIKEREKKILEDKGLTPDEVAPVVEELVQQRLNNDPRMRELDEYRKKRTEEFALKELNELSKLTNGEISDLSQIPKDVVDEWSKTGSLKSAYLKLHGEELINKVRGEQFNGTTNHLKTPGNGSTVRDNKRPLTDDEIRIWKTFNPRMTDEELRKVMVDK